MAARFEVLPDIPAICDWGSKGTIVLQCAYPYHLRDGARAAELERLVSMLRTCAVDLNGATAQDLAAARTVSGRYAVEISPRGAVHISDTAVSGLHARWLALCPRDYARHGYRSPKADSAARAIAEICAAALNRREAARSQEPKG